MFRDGPKVGVYALNDDQFHLAKAENQWTRCGLLVDRARTVPDDLRGVYGCLDCGEAPLADGVALQMPEGEAYWDEFCAREVERPE